MRTLRTARLALEPQVAAHAEQMFDVLRDPAIYEYENEAPASVDALRERFARLETRSSGDGRERWLNWVVRLPSGEAIGYTQATVYPDRHAGIAYVFASGYWGRGFAREAVLAMQNELAAHYHVRRLTAVLKAANQRSLRLLTRLGYAQAVPEPGAIGPDEALMELAMPATAEAVAREWFTRVWNEGQESAIHELLAADAKMHGLPTPDGAPLTGPADFVPFWRKFHSAFPDIRITVERAIAAGDMVAVHCHVVAKHTGHSLGIAATQRPIDMWGMGMARVRDGKIVEAWNAFDFLTLYQQIGLVPALSG
jgi:RimJ/RimL family protein N-acetyltransferase/predicted ester cyclase